MRHFALTLRFALILLLTSAMAAPAFAVESVVVDAGPAATGTIETLHLPAPGVATDPLRVRVLLPPGYRADAAVGYPVLYLNDGQDLEAVALPAAVAQLVAEAAINPPIVVAIDMPSERLAAYGLSDRGARHGLVAQTRFGPVGASAHAYSQWIATTLVPTIDARYRTRTTPDARAALGWSLGALHAFNLGWQYPELFARVGAFSPSLWLAADRDAVQRTRLAQRMLGSSEPRDGLKLFFGVGDAEETDDRDRDGVNDALDDVRDLVDGWNAEDAGGLKGLRQLGYSVNADHAARRTRDDVALYLLPGGRHHQSSWARMLPEFLRWAYARRAPALTATGEVDSYQEFASAHVPARNIDVWLPPGYGDDPQRRYPVLYMHDGQNVFDPALGYTGVDWDVDGAMTRLIAAGRVREAIVVGIWNTPLRFLEYMPRKAVQGESLDAGGPGGPVHAERIISDGYLRFLVEELKPFVDANYRTAPGPDDTFVMGSSMGGLISLYAMAEYPQVFGGVGAVSTHWPIGDGLVIDWLAGRLPDPQSHRIYYDLGTTTVDAAYGPYQQRMDEVMRAAGWREGDNWTTRRFEGAAHNETAWRARVDVPLEFLLGQ